MTLELLDRDAKLGM